MNALEVYAERVREVAPRIEVASIRLNDEGLANDVLIVNEEFVFRFPKTDYGFACLKNEVLLLKLLRGRITLKIPEPFYAGEDCMAYRLIPGETLRRDLLLKLAEDEQQRVADQLAQFLRELHDFPVKEFPELPAADMLRKYDGWANAYARIQEKVFPLLLPHLRDSVREHFESYLSEPRNFEYELKLVDTDIPPYHIMFDRNALSVSGIIDFGCAGLGDPAADFGVIMYNYGESFLRKFYRVYPETESYVKRARFYAGAIEVRWLLTGIERGDPFWFAVHVGGAKDF